MTKHFSEDEKIWWEVVQGQPDKFFIGVGFTQRFMDDYLSECWHILPVHGRVRKGETLVMMETNDGMEKIKSPFTGEIMEFSDLARNFPEKLTSETAFLFFREGEAEEKIIWPPPKKVKQKPEVIFHGGFANFQIDPRVQMVNAERVVAVRQARQALGLPADEGDVFIQDELNNWGNNQQQINHFVQEQPPAPAQEVPRVRRGPFGRNRW